MAAEIYKGTSADLSAMYLGRNDRSKAVLASLVRSKIFFRDGDREH